jgi:hypothetical protein
MKPVYHSQNISSCIDSPTRVDGNVFGFGGAAIGVNIDVNIDETVFEEENDVSAGEESDVSDVYEDEDLGNDGNISNWLEEEDEVSEYVDTSIALTPSIEIPSSPYIQANKRLFLTLIEVEDLNFQNLPLVRQEEVSHFSFQR